MQLHKKLATQNTIPFTNQKREIEDHYPDEIWQIEVADVISNYYIRVHFPDKVLQVKRELKEIVSWSVVLLTAETSFL